MDLCLDGPLWRFAGRFWSRPAAQEAALSLQQQGWSVTDILCGLWLASQGRRFTGYGTGPVTVWRTRVTETLRNARKAITRDNPATDQARGCIARSELEAEKVELALAHSALTEQLAPAGPAAPHQSHEREVEPLALENLQAAAPEKAMDNETGRLLECLIGELQCLLAEASQSC
jgi:uncharacterized protein (TIGR02444 family)